MSWCRQRSTKTGGVIAKSPQVSDYLVRSIAYSSSSGVALGKLGADPGQLGALPETFRAEAAASAVVIDPARWGEHGTHQCLRTRVA
jgi:hypothetical protein